MLPRNFYIDNRVIVSGARNPFLNLADSKWLNDIISQIVLNTTPGNPQLPLVFQNAITRTYVQGIGSQVEWGGTLVKNTTVNGANLYDVTFRFLDEFNVQTSVGDINMAAATDFFMGAVETLTIQGQTSLEVMTPDVVNKTIGAILQLQNDVNGEVEYTPYILPLTDGTANQVLTTDGAGTLTFQDPTSLVPIPAPEEVKYFNYNALNTTVSNNGSGTATIDSYSLGANELINNGSYLEFEIALDIVGTVGDQPEIGLTLNGINTFDTLQHIADNTYTQVIKGKIVKRTNTSLYCSAQCFIYNSTTKQIITSYYRENDRIADWTIINPIVLETKQDLVSDHTVELKHFIISKFLK